MTMNEPIFLEWDDVLAIQYQLVERFGGSHGLRDAGLLESALEMPRSGFGGDYFHQTIFEMAAAYLYHVAKNHPFIDGNKRIALACAHTFMQVNGWRLNASQDELYDLVLRVAAGEITDKKTIALFFEKNGSVV